MISPPQKKFSVIGPDFAAAKIPDDLQARNLAQDPSAAGLLDRMRKLHSTLRAQTVTIPSCFVPLRDFRGSHSRIQVEFPAAFQEYPIP